MLFIFKYLYIYHLILFSKVIICLMLNISVKNHEKIFCHKEFQGYMFIFQKSEGVHPYLLKCCRGTCSFVAMLKGYMVRKRLGTPALQEQFQIFIFHIFHSVSTRTFGMTGCKICYNFILLWVAR